MRTPLEVQLHAGTLAMRLTTHPELYAYYFRKTPFVDKMVMTATQDSIESHVQGLRDLERIARGVLQIISQQTKTRFNRDVTVKFSKPVVISRKGQKKITKPGVVEIIAATPRGKVFMNTFREEMPS